MKRVPLIISITLLLCIYANAQSAVDLGAASDGIYTNPDFGFTFKYPKDWVVHGEATNERIRELGKEKLAESGAVSKSTTEVSLKSTYHLFTLFRYPVGKPGVGFNPAILVMAEKVDHAPGIINGKDFLLNLRALLLKTGAQPLFEQPMEYRIGETQFFRDNYAFELNGVRGVQEYFARIAKGYALVFVFIGEDQKSADEMAKAMDTYASAPRKTVTTIKATPRKPH